MFLGDLFHAREAHARETLAAMTAWREAHASSTSCWSKATTTAVPARCPPRSRSAWCRSRGPSARLRCAITRSNIDGGFVIAGHLHPAVRLSGRGDDSLRLPCFWWRERLAILPAFGEFTGGATIAREAGDRVVAVAERRLYEIPAMGSGLAFCPRRQRRLTQLTFHCGWNT